MNVLATFHNHKSVFKVVEADDTHYKIVNSEYYEGWLLQKNICEEVKIDTAPQPSAEAPGMWSEPSEEEIQIFAAKYHPYGWLVITTIQWYKSQQLNKE